MMTVSPQQFPIVQAPEFKLALEPTNFDGAFRLAAIAAKLQLCGVTSAEDALVRIMAGREAGLTTFQSLRLVYVVNGRPAFDATFLVARCLQHPDCEYFEPVASDATKATYRTKRKGRPEFVFTYSIEDADRDGLTKKKGNWDTARPDMLRARAASKLARAYWQDAVNGVYARNEVEDGEVPSAVPANVDPVTGEIHEAPPVGPVPQAASRDFYMEAEALKARIADAKTDEEKKALRAEIKNFDGGEPYVGELKKFYSETHGAPTKNASTEAAQ